MYGVSRIIPGRSRGLQVNILPVLSPQLFPQQFVGSVRVRSLVASQFVITFQFVINYYKLERICNTIASQFVINYYKLERICTAAASQFVINYYKLARISNVFAFQFVIKYYILDDTQSTLENKGERFLPLSS